MGQNGSRLHWQIIQSLVGVPDEGFYVFKTVELFQIGFCKCAGVDITLDIFRVKHFILQNYYATKNQDYHNLFTKRFVND